MHPRTGLAHTRTRLSIRRAHRLAAGLGVLLLALLPVAGFADTPQTEGRWTNPGDPGAFWDHTQIHMALLPGDSAYHSYVLSWTGENESGFIGGLWGWNRQSPDSGCQSYPTSSLVRIASEPGAAGADFFCAGLANVLTPDGPRLLIAGGHDPLGEEASVNGIKEARLFDPFTRDWTMTSDMAYRRYYPTVTKLSSKYGAITINGWQFYHMLTFGGRSEPDDSSTATDNIERLAIMDESQWDAPKTPSGTWPAPRAFHTAVVTPESNKYFQGMIVYGGIDDEGEVRRDGWRLSRSALTDHSEEYMWGQIDDGLWPRLTYHGGISPNVDTMYVFGGLNDLGAAQSAVHRMYDDGDFWASQALTTSGDSPGARYDHAVAYDGAHGRKRLIVFGGRDDTDALADTAVYALDLRTLAWKKLALGPNSDTPPASRAGHVLLSDDPGKYKRLSASPESNWTRMVLFGGETGASEYSDEVWMLWMSPTSPDTVEWLQVDPDTSNGKPAGRAHHAAVWQRKHLVDIQDRMVLSGGDTGDEDGATDTWVLHVEWPDDGNPSNFAPAWVPQAATGASLSGHTAIRDFLETQALYPEVFDADSKTWSTLTSAPRRFLYTYPHMFLLPSGNLFQAGQWTVADLLKLDENPPAWEDSSWASALLAQSSVMYEPGKVMKCGFAGVSGIDTEVIAFDEEDNCITPTGNWVGLANSDFQDRGELNLTILPDGRVIATGGYGSDATTGPQIWDPDASSEGSWTEYGELALEPAERGYHSSALLLPSGQILSGGDDLNVPDRTGQNRKHATVYCPPYLFDSNGDPAPRPEIDCGSGHLEMTYGDTVSVTVADPADVEMVSLVRAGAVTHAFNQDQRYIELAIVDTIGSQLLVEAPPDSNRAPPGYWLLFLVDANATPSIASWVRLEGTPLGDPCDTVEPEEIDDLTVELISLDGLYFSWRASADDQDLLLSGPGTEFTFRYWADPINNESAWNQATASPIEDSPGSYNAYHEDQVDDLESCTTYYLAMRELDDNANLSDLHGQVSGKTLCTGGGGFAPGTAQLAAAMSGVVAGSGEPLPQEADGTVHSTNSTTVFTVVETELTEAGKWRVLVRQAEGSSLTDIAGDPRAWVQQADGSGGWKTLSGHSEALEESHLGLCALRDGGRIVLPGDYQVGAIPERLETPAGAFAVTEATHSVDGELNLEELSSYDASLLESGDSLQLVFETTSSSETDPVESWYVVLDRVGMAPSSLDDGAVTPRPTYTFALGAARPNPSTGKVRIDFSLARETGVSIRLYNVAGRLVRTLVNESRKPGDYHATWDARDDGGVRVPGGVYFYRMLAGDFESQRKVVFLGQ